MSGQYRRGRPRRTVRDDPERMWGAPPTVPDRTLLNLLPSTAAGLARRVGLDRSTVYERLRTLEAEQLAVCDRTGNVHVWAQAGRPPTPTTTAVDAWLAAHREGAR